MSRQGETAEWIVSDFDVLVPQVSGEADAQF